jgi:hypothetical protein
MEVVSFKPPVALLPRKNSPELIGTRLGALQSRYKSGGKEK